MQAAWGQDQMEGICIAGSLPGHVGGFCQTGISPLIANCATGTAATPDSCGRGGNVTPGPSCTTGLVPLAL